MYFALFVSTGLVLAVPVTAVAFLVGWATGRFLPHASTQRIRRTTALVLGVGLIVAMTIPGAGWYVITFVIPLCLTVGMVAGYTVIEWFVKQSANMTHGPDQGKRSGATVHDRDDR